MAKRGTYKYICDECQAENWLSAKDRVSSFKPHCIECGSMRLSPSKGSRGPDKLAEWHQETYRWHEIHDEKEDDEDTTVSATDCAYDRIIINEDSYAEYTTSGIYTIGIDSAVSDHYLVWIELEADDD